MRHAVSGSGITGVKDNLFLLVREQGASATNSMETVLCLGPVCIGGSMRAHPVPAATRPGQRVWGGGGG